MAILGSETFDVSQVDTWSLVFAGLYPKMKGDSPLCTSLDVSGDGLTDLTCTYVFDRNAFSPDGDSATLYGQLLDGTPFSASDSVVIK